VGLILARGEGAAVRLPYEGLGVSSSLPSTRGAKYSLGVLGLAGDPRRDQSTMSSSTAHRTGPVCSWMGMAPDEEHEITCGRPAQHVIVEPEGRKHFACSEHVGEVHARAPQGSLMHNAQALDKEGRERISSESAITWQ
jgi:hypothetical protein